MAVWANDLQNVSYKNVAFEILSVTDSNQKSLAEHARPFVNGIDLEDMGAQARQVQVSAIFYGARFATDMQKLMQVLEEQGAGVLVHPIFGRMQNMIASSWSFKVQAESVNYVAIDITFREATAAQSIFVFENQWLMALETALNTIRDLTNTILSYSDNILAVKNGISSLWGSANGVYAALQGVVGSVRQLFDLDSAMFPKSGSYSARTYSANVQKQVTQLSEMVRIGLNNEASQSADTLPARQRYDATVIKNNQLLTLPDQVLISQDSEDKDAVVRRLNKMTAVQMAPVSELLNLISVTVLVQIVVDLIEHDSEVISANDLMHINNDMRQRLQARIDAVRQTYQRALQNKSESANALYTQSEETTEQLKQTASQLNQLVLTVINRKPPLRVMQARISGTIHQFAHDFYQDIGRADELMRLNPHLTHPSFINRGDWINYYAK
ncbi:DNA circularization N-terminal domain-containing protein [Neisseriaceae bacterium ESL0693]|nr:DNA circularization N-terminal domain-containing protein [Neisseriaceae bacterium ESL0693]